MHDIRPATVENAASAFELLTELYIVGKEQGGRGWEKSVLQAVCGRGIVMREFYRLVKRSYDFLLRSRLMLITRIGAVNGQLNVYFKRLWIRRVLPEVAQRYSNPDIK